VNFWQTIGAVVGIGILCLVVHYYAFWAGYRMGQIDKLKQLGIEVEL
jgi:hypothetical protein